MSYQAITWINRDKANNIAGTKLNADNLNHLEQGIGALDTALAQLAVQVDAIDPTTGTGLTDEQSLLLTTVSDSLKTVQDGLTALTEQFNAHVHSNEIGETTGEVV